VIPLLISEDADRQNSVVDQMKEQTKALDESFVESVEIDIENAFKDLQPNEGPEILRSRLTCAVSIIRTVLQNT
jgi:uncharacterized phage protein gp47/JayE